MPIQSRQFASLNVQIIAHSSFSPANNLSFEVLIFKHKNCIHRKQQFIIEERRIESISFDRVLFALVFVSGWSPILETPPASKSKCVAQTTFQATRSPSNYKLLFSYIFFSEAFYVRTLFFELTGLWERLYFQKEKILASPTSNFK